MKKRLLFAAAFLAAAAAPAPAQQPIQLILNFDGAQLETALTEMGATWERRTNNQGAPFYAIKFRDNGPNTVAYLTLCRDQKAFTGCTGLTLRAGFSKPDPLTPGGVAQRVNQFNTGHPGTMVSYASNGTSQINMVIIASAGIAIANMKAHLQFFDTSARVYSQALYAQ
jgi:hypothetical protein